MDEWWMFAAIVRAVIVIMVNEHHQVMGCVSAAPNMALNRHHAGGHLGDTSVILMTKSLI
jgi:hypothetical protein